MAEVVSLASFDLDTNKLKSSLDAAQEKYFALKKEQEDTAKKSKDVKKQIDLLTKAQEALTSASGDNTEAIEKNAKEIQDLVKQEKELYKAQESVKNQMNISRKEITQTTAVLNAYRDTEGKTTSLIDLGNKALERQINNKSQAKQANIALNKVADQLNPAIEEENALLIKLNAQMDKNTEFIKENSSETAKQKMNVGNYTKSIIDAYKALEEEEKALNDCKVALLEQIDATEKGTKEYTIYIQQLNILNVQLEDVSDSMAKARGESESLAGEFTLLGRTGDEFVASAQRAGGAGPLLTNTFAALRTGILGALQAGLAFIATPIGAAIATLAVAVGLVVGAFKLATATLKSTEEGSQRLAVVTGAITGVFKGFFKVLKPLGEFLANQFIKYLENVCKTAELVAEGLAKVLDFIGAESAAKGIRNFTNEVKASSVAAANLAKAEGELAVQQRQAQKIQLDYQKQAEKLRQQRDDETNSISKRIAINNQLGEVLRKQSDSELAIANKQLQVAKLRIKSDGETTEALDKLAEAQTNISDIQERITGQESEQLANLNSLRKEASDKEKERQEKLTEALLKNSKARIDEFIAEQGFRKKSAEEAYQFNYDLYNKEYADLKLQLDKKKITQQEYDAQLLQLRNDYLAKNAELTIENAQLELDAELSKNQKILDSDKFLSQQQYDLKKQALENELQLQTEFEKIRLEQGQINQQEYNNAINAINEENRVANAELDQERKVADQEKQLADLEALKITNEENFLAQAEIQKAQNEILRQQEVDNAEKTGADISLINAKYAKMQADIEKQKQDNKIQLASDAFGGLVSIFGAESKAGKAAAIAQTTIDTYKSATSAFSSLSGIPIVGPVLGGIAAAAAVASGLANVKRIVGTKEPSISKTPSYASGVIGIRGVGGGTTDDIRANLSSGESVINARSTAMFANELSAINQAGGGVGLNGSSNILDQTNIQQRANDSQLVNAIAEAVALGAELGTNKGSQDGIRKLTDDRIVMQNAKF